MDQYEPLVTRHIKAILESGLLLDEDYEVLLNATNFQIYPAKTTALPVGLIASGLTTFASIFIAKRYDRPLIILPPLAVTFVSLVLKRRALSRKRRHQEIVHCVVKCFTRVRKVNTSILHYLKLRNLAKQGGGLLLYNENVEEFVAIFVHVNVSYFKWCLEQLRFLVGLSEDLSEDYKLMEEIDVEKILSLDGQNYELLVATIQDLHTFLASKYLNYLGIVLGKILSGSINKRELMLLLDKKLPTAKATLDELSLLVQREFNNLRYCASKKLEIDTHSRSSFRQQLSGKLQQTLVGAVNNLSIIMEKSRSVLSKIEAMENDKDAKQFEQALSDLRGHAYATYESLDILCKLYGILSDPRAVQGDKKIPIKENTHINTSTTTINYDDNSEALEENYELYIPDNEEVNLVTHGEICEDQAGIYLNLMIKELRQSLKQHERFIAARNKRTANEENDGPSKNTEPIPKFDLQRVNLKKEDFEEKLPVPAPRASKLPPPPPPPLPSLIHSDHNICPNKSLFESVRNLSSQLKGQEEVFGDDNSSDSD